MGHRFRKHRRLFEEVLSQSLGPRPRAECPAESRYHCVSVPFHELNSHLTVLQSFSSFVESRAQTLSDLLFYVSSENYASATRASYGEILYWPKAWTLPSKIRAKAIKRSEHLGLSSLDVDFASAQEESQKTRKSDDLPRGLIARPRDTVISLLGTPTRRNQFRLDALTSELFEPLDTLLAEKGFLLSDSTPSSLDCLVIGYLSPILWATLPQEWMKRSLRSDYPPLAKYVQRFSNQCFGSPVSPSAVLQGRHNHGSAEGLHLPWQASEEPSTLLRGGQMFECILDTIPGVDHLRARKSLRNTATKIDENAVRQRRANSQKLYRQAVAVSVGFSAFVGYLVWGGVLQMSTDESGSVGRKSFGPAGAMLGLSRD